MIYLLLGLCVFFILSVLYLFPEKVYYYYLKKTCYLGIEREFQNKIHSHAVYGDSPEQVFRKLGARKIYQIYHETLRLNNVAK